MERARVRDVELDFEVRGSGEPVLLITCGPIADGFVPLMSQSPLLERYRLVRYHRRGMAGSTRTTPPVSCEEHAADAAALLAHLGIDRAHVAGHSTGGSIALEFAATYPELVHSLVLLEPLLFTVPGVGAFLDRAGPALAAYGSGDRETAMAAFLAVACTLEWEAIRRLLEMHAPGSVAQTMTDVENFFGSEIPAVSAWQFGAERAAAIEQPILAVLGEKTDPLFREGNGLLHSWFPHIQDCLVEGTGHLLHLQRPEAVARGMLDFLARHAIPPRLHAAG